MTKRKDRNKHNFWQRIHFKYRLSVINENTLEETMKFRISKFTGFVFFVGFMLFFVILTSVIIITTPIRNYLPGYLDTEIRAQAIHSAVRADSLEQQLLYQAAYLDNLKDVFSGKMQMDSISYVDTVNLAENDPALLSSDREKEFTDKFENEEKYNISVLPGGSAPVAEGIMFFQPVKGLVSDRFNPSIQHYGIDIVAAPKESVVSTLEGTVVFVGNDPNVGNVIEIQHKNGFVSVYKHNAAVLKKIGDKVRTGEAIAIVGNSGELSNGDHLHFELWYKGNPVNPELYISFQ